MLKTTPTRLHPLRQLPLPRRWEPLRVTPTWRLIQVSHEDVITWKRFTYYKSLFNAPVTKTVHNSKVGASTWRHIAMGTPSAFVRGIHRWLVVSPNKGAVVQSFHIFSVVKTKGTVEQTVDLSVTWDAMALMWYHCNVLFDSWCQVYPQRTHDVKITSLWRQNDVATSFWCHNDVIFYVVCPPGFHEISRSRSPFWIKPTRFDHWKTIRNQYSKRISWLLMPWCRASPVHMQPWCWVSKVGI